MTIPVPVNVVVDIKQLLQCWIPDDHSPENKCQIVDSAVPLMKTLQYCYHLFGSSTASQCGSCFAAFRSGTLTRLQSIQNKHTHSHAHTHMHTHTYTHTYTHTHTDEE